MKAYILSEQNFMIFHLPIRYIMWELPIQTWLQGMSKIQARKSAYISENLFWNIIILNIESFLFILN